MSLLFAAVAACSGEPAFADRVAPPQALSPRVALEVAPAKLRAPYDVQVLRDNGDALPTYASHDRFYVEGNVGERYLIRVTNPTPNRVEAVISVDGLDVIDGEPADTHKRGYIVPAHASIVVDGWRTSLDTVAAFRFATVPQSYAAMTGNDANVGVIGVAFFGEQPPPPPRPMVAHRAAPMPAAPASRGAADGARPGLGTQFGESHESRVQEVEFRRAEARPMTVAELRYDDRQGLLARGIHLPPRDQRDLENQLRDHAQPFADNRFAQPPR